MSASPASRRLALTVRLSSGALAEATRKFWTHPRLAETYPEHLIRAHCAARANIPLMKTTLERARALSAGCPVAARLVPYLDRHIHEETGHDDWLLEDLAVLGVDREAALARVPSPECAGVIGPLYYWVLHTHPVTILSYFFVVEGNPFTVELLDEVVARTGLPPEALRTFRRHAHLDIRHAAEISRLLDELPLEKRHMTLLEMSALSVVEQLARFMERLVRLADEATGTPTRSPLLTGAA
jgi:hypothetical protein